MKYPVITTYVVFVINTPSGISSPTKVGFRRLPNLFDLQSRLKSTMDYTVDIILSPPPLGTFGQIKKGVRGGLSVLS